MGKQNVDVKSSDLERKSVTDNLLEKSDDFTTRDTPKFSQVTGWKEDVYLLKEFL